MDQHPPLMSVQRQVPPSQNKLWSVLARNRFYPVVQAGDLKQAFLQERTREGDRETMRFHWLKDLETKQVEPLRFTRALFGMSTTPFNLGGVINQHLRNLSQNFPNEVEEVRRSLCVDNLTKNNSNLCRFAISSHNCVMWRVVNLFVLSLLPSSVWSSVSGTVFDDPFLSFSSFSKFGSLFDFECNDRYTHSIIVRLG